jgi:hypothetical protein
MDEAVEQATTIVLPVADDAPSPSVTLAHSEVHALLGGSVCTVPMVDAGRAIGAMTLERASKAFVPTEVAFCEDVACLVAPARADDEASAGAGRDRRWRKSASRIAGSARAGTTGQHGLSPYRRHVCPRFL